MTTVRCLTALVVLALAAALAGCGDGPPSSLFNASGYHVRGDTVYYLNAFPGDAVELEQADAATFTALDSTYAKDSDTVFLDGVPLAEADAASFELLDEPNYSRDARHVFVRDRVLTEDVDHFTLDGGFARDSLHVYGSGGEVLSDDPEHFVEISHDDGYLFTKDSTVVSVSGNAIKGADPATFEVLRGAYAKDAEETYYFDQVVDDADPASFEALEGSYARDRNHAYWMGKVVPGADPGTFVVLNPNFECTADAEHAYYRDQLIQGFDPSTIPADETVTNCSETSLSTY